MAQSKTASFRWGVLFIGIFVGVVAGLALALTAAWKLGGNALVEVFASNKEKPVATQRIPNNGANTPAKNGNTEKPSFDFYKVLPEGGDATAKSDKTLPSPKLGAIATNTSATPATTGSKPAAVASVQDKPTIPIARQTSPDTPISTKPKEIYWLQVGSFARKDDAENRQAELALFGWEATVQKGDVPGRGILYRVRVGPYDNAEQTGRMKSELSQRKFEVAVVRQ